MHTTDDTTRNGFKTQAGVQQISILNSALCNPIRQRAARAYHMYTIMLFAGECAAHKYSCFQDPCTFIIVNNST